VFRRVLAMMLGPALALLTLEGVSRCYFNYQSVRHPILGSVVPAGHTFRSRIEGAGVAYHDQDGVRRARALGPRHGTQVLCVGDSYTEANQVSDDEVYTTLVERSLNRAGMPAAVLNIGRSGLSIADYVANAAAFVASTSAGWTVVQVHDLDFGPEAWQASKTHFQRRCPACPVEAVWIPPAPDSAARLAGRRLRNQSAFVGFAMQRAQELAGATPPDKPAAPAEAPAAMRRTGVVDADVADELRLLADAYRGRLTLLLLGRFDPAAPGRSSAEEAAIERAARALGLSLACSRDEYEALAERGTAPYGFPSSSLNSGHLNAAGHAAAARVLTRELLRLHAAGAL
jgi:hypothetical protein